MNRSRGSLRTLLIVAVAATIVGVVALFGLAGSGGRTGRPAPALPSQALSGSRVTLAALRGRPALVTFWASWCEPCEREAPALERFAQGLGARATLVGVNWSDPSLSGARAFVRRYRWTFPNLRDPQGSTGLAYGVTGLPTTFALDRSGKVRATLRGPQTKQTLTAALASAGV
ncbi:MAG TPA: redoxin family protein [Solirubrobacteraceae bacterium]|jgi:cytochrome c biogenesis protein CcmG/thiol:disulfide interchange protein DsbE|nr:redoxin family protein [Solirubrobacteraceae bacterium]